MAKEIFKKDDKEGEKEEFCGACLAVPAAMLASGAVSGGAEDGNSRTKKNIKYFVSIGILVLAIGLTFYFSSSCSSCSANVKSKSRRTKSKRK